MIYEFICTMWLSIFHEPFAIGSRSVWTCGGVFAFALVIALYLAIVPEDGH